MRLSRCTAAETAHPPGLAPAPAAPGPARAPGVPDPGRRAWLQHGGRLLGACTPLAAAAALAGCAAPVERTSGGVPIDRSITATGQDSRVLFLILHYTVADLRQSIHILSRGQVSSHYLLTDETPPRVLGLVDESRRAWHSGPSGWKGHRLLNASSIGIEIVHPGFRPGPDKSRIYQPFPQAQIDVLVPLVRDIVRRHQIRPERILGHGEVTPQFKEDPGPTFPWRQLADLGITPPWPDAQRTAQQQQRFEREPPDVAWWQKQLAEHGYVIEPSGQWDEQTRRVLMNFQMRWRPARHDGQPDAESAALLHGLTTPRAGTP